MIDRRKFLKFGLIAAGILTGGAAFLKTFLSSDDELFKPAYTVLDGTYKLHEGHPRIFLSEDRLNAIRKRCADKKNAQSTYYGYLKNYADKFIASKTNPSAHDCLVFAFMYALGEVPGYDYSIRSITEYGKIGGDILMQLSPPTSYGGFAESTPVLIACYDWLFPAMAPRQRASVFQRFTSVADAMSKKVPVLGQYRGTAEMYGYYGLAFSGDGKYIYPDDTAAADGADRKAKAYSDFFVSWHKNGQVTVLETTCKGGAYPAGTMYGEAPFPRYLWPLDSWDTASPAGLYSSTTIFTGYPLFLLYQILPYRTHVRMSGAHGKIEQPGGLVRFGDYRYIGYTACASRHFDINIAQAQGVVRRRGHDDLGSVFNWLIQFRDKFKVEPFGGPFPLTKRGQIVPSAIWDIVLRDGLAVAKSPGEVNLPLTYHFGSTDSGLPIKPDLPHGCPEGGGVVVMRSSWDNPDGTLVWFKASSRAVIHSHRDQGSFQIYKKGWLAIDSGQYEETTHLGNYSSRTIAHNSILIYRPGESPPQDKVNPIWHGYANDGGQRWAKVSRTLDEVTDINNFLGGVTKFESVTGIYDYLHADMTRSYNSNYVTDEYHPSKVALVTRSLLYLRPDEYIVIFDRVTSTNAEYPKRWLLHSIYRPELDGTETFQGVIPYSQKIPGKARGVNLRGDKRGGISESKDSSIATIKGWNFGPSEGRLICRTLLPQKHITRIAGGADSRGVHKTYLAKAFRQQGGGKENAAIVLQSLQGFEVGDFVYLGPTDKPYAGGSSGRPNWPVDDIYYQGWGKIKTIDNKTNSIAMVPYRYSIPDLPEGTPVMRSDHANANSYEFMDAEYNQWQMHGESVANAGPFYDQHGSWRIEVEPIEKKTNDVFLHVMLPCDKDTLDESQRALKENVKVVQGSKTAEIEIKGKERTYKITFDSDSPDARITVTEANKTILDNQLTREAIKTRAGNK